MSNEESKAPNRPTLKLYKTHPQVQLPQFHTNEAACFDLHCNFWGKSFYNIYRPNNKLTSRSIQKNVYVSPGERVMVPTGIIFDIPKGYSIRLHPRSGLALKSGIILVNQEAVIDSDYVEETFVLVYNISDTGFIINNGDRIAQGELVRNVLYNMEETDKQPEQKGNRKGGMGSTGT